jgi:hypothetical protein
MWVLGSAPRTQPNLIGFEYEYIEQNLGPIHNHNHYFPRKLLYH